MKSKAYRATDVKNVVLEGLLKSGGAGPITVGLDVGKSKVYAVVRWSDGRFERPWKIDNPTEVLTLVRLLQTLGQERKLTIAMEPTGTYADALRGQLALAELALHRVRGKAAHDYAEVFDGVPSQHDGKDAAVIAELAAFGKASPWPFVEKSEREAELSGLVEWLDTQQHIQGLWIGRLEGLVSRHWPEVTRLLELTSMTLLKALAHYGGPRALAADPEAAGRLARWGRAAAGTAKLARVVASAAATVGMSQSVYEERQLRRSAAQALAAAHEVRQARRRLEELVEADEALQREADVVGPATACVLRAALGDPRDYSCGEAYRKAMGLNLKERSSGKHQGRLKITKRGPSLARKWMYFAALRTVQIPIVKSWYEAKKFRDRDRGMGALIAVARKLALALYVVATRAEPFEPERLFPGRPLVRKGASGPPAGAAPVVVRNRGGELEEEGSFSGWK